MARHQSACFCVIYKLYLKFGPLLPISRELVETMPTLAGLLSVNWASRKMVNLVHERILAPFTQHKAKQANYIMYFDDDDKGIYSNIPMMVAIISFLTIRNSYARKREDASIKEIPFLQQAPYEMVYHKFLSKAKKGVVKENQKSDTPWVNTLHRILEPSYIFSSDLKNPADYVDFNKKVEANETYLVEENVVQLEDLLVGILFPNYSARKVKYSEEQRKQLDSIIRDNFCVQRHFYDTMPGEKANWWKDEDKANIGNQYNFFEKWCPKEPKEGDVEYRYFESNKTFDCITQEIQVAGKGRSESQQEKGHEIDESGQEDSEEEEELEEAVEEQQKKRKQRAHTVVEESKQEEGGGGNKEGTELGEKHTGKKKKKKGNSSQDIEEGAGEVRERGQIEDTGKKKKTKKRDRAAYEGRVAGEEGKGGVGEEEKEEERGRGQPKKKKGRQSRMDDREGEEKTIEEGSPASGSAIGPEWEYGDHYTLETETEVDTPETERGGTAGLLDSPESIQSMHTPRPKKMPVLVLDRDLPENLFAEGTEIKETGEAREENEWEIQTRKKEQSENLMFSRVFYHMKRWEMFFKIMKEDDQRLQRESTLHTLSKCMSLVQQKNEGSSEEKYKVAKRGLPTNLTDGNIQRSSEAVTRCNDLIDQIGRKCAEILVAPIGNVSVETGMSTNEEKFLQKLTTSIKPNENVEQILKETMAKLDSLFHKREEFTIEGESEENDEDDEENDLGGGEEDEESEEGGSGSGGGGGEDADEEEEVDQDQESEEDKKFPAKPTAQPFADLEDTSSSSGSVPGHTTPMATKEQKESVMPEAPNEEIKTPQRKGSGGDKEEVDEEGGLDEDQGGEEEGKDSIETPHPEGVGEVDADEEGELDEDKGGDADTMNSTTQTPPPSDNVGETEETVPEHTSPVATMDQKESVEQEAPSEEVKTQQLECSGGGEEEANEEEERDDDRGDDEERKPSPKPTHPPSDNDGLAGEDSEPEKTTPVATMDQRESVRGESPSDKFETPEHHHDSDLQTPTESGGGSIYDEVKRRTDRQTVETPQTGERERRERKKQTTKEGEKGKKKTKYRKREGSKQSQSGKQRRGGNVLNMKMPKTRP